MAQFLTDGCHITMDLRGVPFTVLNDLAFQREAMYRAVDRCGATVVGESFVQFAPQGVTGVPVLSESHLSIHTYSEEGFAAIDCYTCGPTVDPQEACDSLEKALGGRVAGVRALRRGTGAIVDLTQQCIAR